MRIMEVPQMNVGEIGIGNIRFNPKDKDDIPALLLGLQHVYVNEGTREELFALLRSGLFPEASWDEGRPGMRAWRVMVMAMLKQGLACDF